ncbi:MAG: helix-turn-helix transcriptional regulator [Bacilli bacterium]|nr:helix-turn-helix transcriptional regulator [Bacilli bacterium]
MKNETLTEVIKMAREKKGISQRELARQINVDNSTIAKIEKGKIKQPSEFVLMKIAKYLNLDAKDLLILAGYKEIEINNLNIFTEKNVLNYFDTAPLYEVKQLLDYLNKEIKATKNLKVLMEIYNVKNLDKMTQFTKKEIKRLKKDWIEQIEFHGFKIEALEKVGNRLQELFIKRQENGEEVEENGKDVTDIIEEFINSVTSKK